MKILRVTFRMKINGFMDMNSMRKLNGSCSSGSTVLAEKHWKNYHAFQSNFLSFNHVTNTRIQEFIIINILMITLIHLIFIFFPRKALKRHILIRCLATSTLPLIYHSHLISYNLVNIKRKKSRKEREKRTKNACLEHCVGNIMLNLIEWGQLNNKAMNLFDLTYEVFITTWLWNLFDFIWSALCNKRIRRMAHVICSLNLTDFNFYFYQQHHHKVGT